MSYDIYRDYTEDQLDEYWRVCMNHRMEECYEVSRLVRVLIGYYLESAQYDSIRGYSEYDDYMEFWDSKRPYGSKAVMESIAFNLGWDSGRALCVSEMPKWVEEEAAKLHSLVKEALYGEWDNHLSYQDYLKDHYESIRD